MFAVYQQDCKSGRLRIGKPTIYKKSTPWILNFPTKDHWRFPSKLEYLEKGLEFLLAHYKKVGISSIAFPKLGAQNGKLSWDEVGPLMARYLSQLDIDVYVYIAEGDKEYQYDPLLDKKIQERIWKEFNELALSINRLHQEVGLSNLQAAKVAEKRAAKDFRSLADVECIEKIAKTSLGKIKVYINSQRLTANELPGLLDEDNSHQHRSKKPSVRSSSRKRKKPEATSQTLEKLILPEIELVG